MENKEIENNLRITKDKAEVVFTNNGAGCMLTAGGIMTFGALFILFYIVPNTSIVRAFFGIIIGTIGTLFFGSIFLRMLLAVMKGKALFTVEDGYLKGGKKKIPIHEIQDIYWRDMSIEYIVVHTIRKKRVKLSTHNFVSKAPVNYLIEQYVLPHGSEELRENWSRRQETSRNLNEGQG